MILHLMHPGVDAPITDVGVAPFRSDRHRFRCEPALAKPRSQEPFGKAVRARGIEIANAHVVGGVEDLVRSALQRVDAPVRADVMFPTERDVAGTSDGGQPEPDRRDLEPGGAEGAKRHPGRSGYGCLRIRAFSSSNSASVSTPDCFNSLIWRNCSYRAPAGTDVAADESKAADRFAASTAAAMSDRTRGPLMWAANETSRRSWASTTMVEKPTKCLRRLTPSISVSRRLAVERPVKSVGQNSRRFVRTSDLIDSPQSFAVLSTTSPSSRREPSRNPAPPAPRATPFPFRARPARRPPPRRGRRRSMPRRRRSTPPPPKAGPESTRLD